MRSVLGLSVFALWMVGCGSAADFGGAKKDEDKNDEATPPPPQGGETLGSLPRSMLVQDAAALPACTPEAEGWLVYVKTEAKFKACLAGAWSDIDVAPKPTRIGASIFCNGSLEGTSIWFSYSVAEMTTGDVFVSATIKADAYKQTSSTSFFSAQQVGAATAAITIQDDQVGADNAGYWILELDRATLVTTIVYKDADLGEDSWAMQPSNCIRNAY
jgi:hypothetical protein